MYSRQSRDRDDESCRAAGSSDERAGTIGDSPGECGAVWGDSAAIEGIDVSCPLVRYKPVRTADATGINPTPTRLYNRTESPDDSRLYTYRTAPATAACTFGGDRTFSSDASRVLDGDFGL